MENIEYEKMHRLEKENWWYQARKDLIHKLVAKHATVPQTLIDVGCGNGMVLNSFPRIPHRIGVETHPIGVKYAREKGLTIVSSLDEAPDRASVILMMDVLEHVKNDSEFLHKALEKLSDDGVIIITVPAFQWLWSHHDELVHHVRRYSLRELSETIKKAGGKSEHISYWNASFFLPTLFHKLSSKKNKSNESDLKPVWKPINRALLSTLKMENTLGINVSIPFGTSVFAVISRSK